LDAGDDRPALEHALAVLTPVFAGVFFEWLRGVRHRSTPLAGSALQ
jgi:hypothetical protein